VPNILQHLDVLAWMARDVTVTTGTPFRSGRAENRWLDGQADEMQRGAE